MIPEKLTYEELEQRVKKLENEAVGHKWMERWVRSQRDLLVSLAKASNLEQGLGFCLDAAINVSDLDCGGVYLFDDISGVLNLISHKGLPDDFIREASHYMPDSDNVKLISRGKPVYTQYQQLGVPLDNIHRQENLCAIAVIPIINNNRVIGCLNIASHTLDEIPASSRIALEVIAAQIERLITGLKAEEELRRREAQYRSLVESCDDSIYLVDRHCRYQFVNRRHLDRLGVVPAEISGKPYSEYHSKHDAKDFFRKVKQVFETSDSIQYEHKSHKNNKYFLRTLSPVKNSAGETISVTIVSKDITDRKDVEEELKENSEKIKLFSYSISHDLKNLSISIFGITKRLIKGYSNLFDDKGKKYCEQILKIAEQISSLVDQINVFISAKEMPLNIERVNMGEILKSIKEEFDEQLDVRGIIWLEPEHFPEIKADKLSIMRVLRNAVDNALKYGGVMLSEIHIGFKESEEFYILTVMDNGCGLKDQDNIKDIFDPFIRKETSRGIKGSGLGLAIVKEIAKKHYGDVWLEPAQKTGMKFCISISKDLCKA